jgi:hypothetical protein
MAEGVFKSIAKFTLYAVGGMAMMGGLLYKYQDNLLYMPSMPIQHAKDNPAGM